MKQDRSKDYFALKMVLLVTVILGAFFASFLIGRFSISIETVWDIIRSKFVEVEPYWEETLETVVVQVRLPRILLAILVGGALAVSGASYQTLFKNPMVSPDILGISAGAGLGAALAMIKNGPWWQIQLSALVFGIVAVAITYTIGNIFGRQNITVLVLSGVIVSSFFQALLSIVKTLADTDNQLPSITFWLMGSLGKSSNRDVLIVLPVIMISLLLLFVFRYSIDVLAAGEDQALTMGVNVPLVKFVVVLASTILTVVSVSVCGIIGWVGMVVPHMARMIFGSSYPKLLSSSFLMGGLFLLFVDNIIRGIERVELPLGVLTALIGTPIFVLLISRARKAWL